MVKQGIAVSTDNNGNGNSKSNSKFVSVQDGVALRGVTKAKKKNTITTASVPISRCKLAV